MISGKLELYFSWGFRRIFFLSFLQFLLVTFIDIKELPFPGSSTVIDIVPGSLGFRNFRSPIPAILYEPSCLGFRVFQCYISLIYVC